MTTSIPRSSARRDRVPMMSSASAPGEGTPKRAGKRPLSPSIKRGAPTGPLPVLHDERLGEGIPRPLPVGVVEPEVRLDQQDRDSQREREERADHREGREEERRGDGGGGHTGCRGSH